MPGREAFLANFDGRAPPRLLLELLDFQDGAQTAYCEDFWLAAPGGELLSTYEVQDPDWRVVPFAVNGLGSVFGFWVQDGAGLEDAPVVHLDAEGATNLVVAVGLREFLALLALDQADPSCLMSEEELRAWRAESGGAASPRHGDYLAWLSARGIAPVAEPRQTLSAATAAHPGFARWLGVEEEPLPAEPTARSLDEACDEGDLAAVEAFVAEGLDFSSAAVLEAVSTAIFRDRVAILACFLEAGLDPDAQLSDYATPLLSEAVGVARPGVVRTLLAAGASPEAADLFGRTASSRAQGLDEELGERKAQILELLAAAAEGRAT